MTNKQKKIVATLLTLVVAGILGTGWGLSQRNPVSEQPKVASTAFSPNTEHTPKAPGSSLDQNPSNQTEELEKDIRRQGEHWFSGEYGLAENRVELRLHRRGKSAAVFYVWVDGAWIEGHTVLFSPENASQQWSSSVSKPFVLSTAEAQVSSDAHTFQDVLQSVQVVKNKSLGPRWIMLDGSWVRCDAHLLDFSQAEGHVHRKQFCIDPETQNIIRGSKRVRDW